MPNILLLQCYGTGLVPYLELTESDSFTKSWSWQTKISDVKFIIIKSFYLLIFIFPSLKYYLCAWVARPITLLFYYDALHQRASPTGVAKVWRRICASEESCACDSVYSYFQRRPRRLGDSENDILCACRSRLLLSLFHWICKSWLWNRNPLCHNCSYWFLPRCSLLYLYWSNLLNGICFFFTLNLI